MFAVLCGGWEWVEKDAGPPLDFLRAWHVLGVRRARGRNWNKPRGAVGFKVLARRILGHMTVLGGALGTCRLGSELLIGIFDAAHICNGKEDTQRGGGWGGGRDEPERGVQGRGGSACSGMDSQRALSHMWAHLQ